MDWDDEGTSHNQIKSNQTSGHHHDTKYDEQYDSNTGAHIRQEILKQNQKKRRHQMVQNYNYDYNKNGLNSMPSHLRSISNNGNHLDFRERIKRDSIPHIRTMDTLSILPQYQF